MSFFTVIVLPMFHISFSISSSLLSNSSSSSPHLSRSFKCCFLLTRPHTVNRGYCISCLVTASSLSPQQTWWTPSSSSPGLSVSVSTPWTCQSWTTAPTPLTWSICPRWTTLPSPPPPSIHRCLPRSYPACPLPAWPMTPVHHRVKNTLPTWTTQTCTATGRSWTHTVSPVCGIDGQPELNLFFYGDYMHVHQALKLNSSAGVEN